MQRYFLSLIAATALVGHSPLRAAQNCGSAPAFDANDTVCFVGDSITHGGTYHSLVYLYYTTRFPDRPLQTHNCGIGGDRASGIMSDEKFRLNIDILAHKPTVATIMLGMNDIGHADYKGGASGIEVEKKRQASLDTYDANMQKLIASLQGAGARVILITPSIYDETTTLETARKDITVGGNGALGKCAEKVQRWSKKFNTGLVRVYEVMNEVNTREQKKDPNFTVVGPDRVHPGPVGHAVMAYTFLKAQSVPAQVATINVDAARKRVVTAANCKITELETTADGVSFDYTAKALPLVLPDEAKPALALVPFNKDLNQEKLVVSGLATGTYELKIDGQKVGEYTADQLKSGLNLAENDKTPQYKQAANVAKLNRDRTGIAAQLRGLASQYYGLSKSGVDVADPVAVEAGLKKRLEAASTGNNPQAARVKAAMSVFGKRDQLQRDMEALNESMRRAAQPQERHIAITRLAK